MERTKKLKIIYIILSIISALLILTPIIVYSIKGLAEGSFTGRTTLTIMMMFTICLVIINVVKKYNLRSPLFLMLIGIYACLHNITTLLVIIAITTIIDELIIDPLRKSIKNKYIINKEIDKRS